jgi:flagellin FlaB
MNSMKYSDAGFTGLEAAIVLIAFVVVAAVFSYVVLGAGFFTTQKSQQVVHTGVQQASSTLEVAGSVYGVDISYDIDELDTINFSLALAPGGTPVDFDKVVLTYSNSSEVMTLQYQGFLEAGYGGSGTSIGPGEWAVATVEHDVGTHNHLLESGEIFDIMAMPPDGIYPNDEINLEIKPAVGPSLLITRKMPGWLNTVNVLS